MKFTKHQKEIIKAINCGKVYDMYTYLQYFNLLEKFQYDLNLIKRNFEEEYGQNLYKVLKKGKSQYSFGVNGGYYKSELKEEDFEYKKATLDLECLKQTSSYGDKQFTFNPVDKAGVEIAKSFESIKEFIVIWSYLTTNLLVLEVPKEVEPKDIGIFFEKRSVAESKYFKYQNLVVRNPLSKVLKKEGIQDLLSEMNVNSTSQNISAINYVDEIIKINKDNLVVCNKHISKKLLSTPELELFIKRNYKTQDQINYFCALVPAYLSVLICIIVPIIQGLDDSDSILREKHVHEIKQELKTIQMKLESLNNEMYDVNTYLKNEDELNTKIIELIDMIISEENQE